MTVIQYSTVIGHDIKPFVPVISNEQKCSFGVLANGIKLTQENNLNLPSKVIYQNKTQNGKTFITTNSNNWAATDVYQGDTHFFYKIRKYYDTASILIDDEVAALLDEYYIYTNKTSNVVVKYLDESNNVVACLEQEIYPIFINRALTNLNDQIILDNKFYVCERVNNRLKITYSKEVDLIVNLADEDCLDFNISNKTLSWNQAIFSIGNHHYDFYKQKYITHQISSELHVVNGTTKYLKLDHQNIFSDVLVSVGTIDGPSEVNNVIAVEQVLVHSGLVDISSLLSPTDENIYIYVEYRYLAPSYNTINISQLNDSYNKLSILLYNNQVGYVLNTADQIYISSNIEGQIVWQPSLEFTSETNDEIDYRAFVVEGNESIPRESFFYDNVIEEFVRRIIVTGIENNADDVGQIIFYAKKLDDIDLVIFQRAATLKNSVYEHNKVEKYAESIVVFGEVDPAILPFNYDIVLMDKEITLQTDITSLNSVSVDISDIQSVIDMDFTLVNTRDEQYYAIRNYEDSRVCSVVDPSYGAAIKLIKDGDEYGFDGYILEEENKILLFAETDMTNTSIIKVIYSPLVSDNIELT